MTERCIKMCIRDSGISEWKIFWRIRLPMAKPGIISGVTLAFARAIGESGATSMLAGNIAGKTSTISQQIATVSYTHLAAVRLQLSQ